MEQSKTPKETIEQVTRELEEGATVAEVRRELEGDYEETFTDSGGARYYKDIDGVRVYLAPETLPPKKGDPLKR